MARIKDISQSVKVREINQLIINSFKKFIPLAQIKGGASVLLYGDKTEYERTYQRVTAEETNRILSRFKRDYGDLYRQAEKIHGTSVPSILRGLSVLHTFWRYQSANISSDGFYASFSNTLHLLKDDTLTIAHELFHKYSYGRDAEGPYSYFEKLLPSDMAEGIIESLSLDIAKAYARKHNLKNDLRLYESAEYPRIVLSKDYLNRNSFSGTSILHLLFEGWFRADPKKGFVPSDAITTPRDLKKFSDQEATNTEAAIKWLAVSKVKKPGIPLKAPGQAPVRSAMGAGLVAGRPVPGEGPTPSLFTRELGKPYPGRYGPPATWSRRGGLLPGPQPPMGLGKLGGVRGGATTLTARGGLSGHGATLWQHGPVKWAEKQRKVGPPGGPAGPKNWPPKIGPFEWGPGPTKKRPVLPPVKAGVADAGGRKWRPRFEPGPTRWPEKRVTVSPTMHLSGVHVVVEGQVLSRIARQHGTTVNEIARQNPWLLGRKGRILKGVDFILPGDVIRVPQAPTTGFLHRPAKSPIAAIAASIR